MVAITGNTYPIKEQLKRLGGKWDPDSKQWLVPDSKAEEARALLATVPSYTKRTYKRPFVHHKCTVCGTRASRYVPIYRSGECRDCYEERKMGY